MSTQLSWQTLDQEHGRSFAPFIFKIRYYKPTVENQSKNQSHLDYIGHRPGVDYGDDTLNGRYDDDLEPERFAPNTPASHAAYIDERPGSHGLFTSTGVRPNIADLKEDLANHQGIVWRVVLSLKEQDAIDLGGWHQRQKWEDMLRAQMPEAAKQMGIKEQNLNWVAAFHDKKDQPHVHIVMWEKIPDRKEGRITDGERKDMKRLFVNQIYGEERARWQLEKTEMRNLILQQVEKESKDMLMIIKEMGRTFEEVELEQRAIGAAAQGIAPTAHAKDMQLLARKLERLAEQMPGKGRAAFQYMPQEVKTEALDIAEQLLKHPLMKEQVDRYAQAAENDARVYTIHTGKLQQVRDNAVQDLKKRMANVVIRGAAEINKDKRKNSKAAAKSSESKRKGLAKVAEHESDSIKRKASERFIKPSALVAKNVWKSVWHGLDRARRQEEAKGELQRRRAMRKQQREQEHDR